MFLSKDEIISIEKDLLETIIKEDGAKNSLTFSMMKGISLSNKFNIEKYFWFQLPIRAVLKKYLCSKQIKDTFFHWLLRYIFIAIPEEKTKIVNEICYSPQVSEKVLTSDYQEQVNSLVEISTFLESQLS